MTTETTYVISDDFFANGASEEQWSRTEVRDYIEWARTEWELHDWQFQIDADSDGLRITATFTGDVGDEKANQFNYWNNASNGDRYKVFYASTDEELDED